jgi:hypothetical protein
MPRKPSPESNADIEHRKTLNEFLRKTHSFLLWIDADTKLHGVEASLDIRNPKWRRDALTLAGVFGEELRAKERLFEYFSEEERFLAVLRVPSKRVQESVEGVSVLSAVKEFIDAVLCARDWLPGDPEITTLGDLR